ncbi:hypothetical protein L4D76_25025 [Photobacterium sagamiensis]|uniref:hypothetical protein n=1 Tax=Photobacterium sagamiensis TaxID=2910241 RepID=UPI003D0C0F65
MQKSYWGIVFNGAAARLIAKHSTKVEKPHGVKWGFFVFENVNDGDTPVFFSDFNVSLPSPLLYGRDSNK